eukprot:UN00754
MIQLWVIQLHRNTSATTKELSFYSYLGLLTSLGYVTNKGQPSNILKLLANIVDFQEETLLFLELIRNRVLFYEPINFIN